MEAGELEEAEVVKIIYEKFAHDSMGADSICSYLNQRGYAKQKKREFELNYFARGLIMRVLDNPVYIGKITYGKSTTEQVKGTRDEYHRVQVEDYMVTDGKHEAIADIDSQIGGVYEKQITSKQLYKILVNFDKLYYRLTDLEKKEFLRDFIESAEIYPEKMDDGRMLKHLKNGIYETTEFLELFLRNLLLNEEHTLHNRTLRKYSNQKLQAIF